MCIQQCGDLIKLPKAVVEWIASLTSSGPEAENSDRTTLLTETLGRFLQVLKHMKSQGSVVGMVIKLEATKFCVRVPAEPRDFSVGSAIHQVSLFNRQQRFVC